MAWADMSLPMDEVDFFVRLIPFPRGKSHGATTPNEDGTYSVYIDENADRDTQLSAYWHEYEHLAYEDFDNGKDIHDIEDI